MAHRALRRRYGHAAGEFAPLTAEQLQALRHFAKRQGRYWKDRMRDMWMHGAHISGSDADVVLYTLRNTHGPRWLNRFRLSGGAS